jgi:hypothetical protein
MRFLAILALVALPAQAEDCFSGSPRKVTYDNGQVITIIQRHGDDLTYTSPSEGNQDIVRKTHLMLFPKQSRAGARSSEHRWTSRLPRLRDLVPGYAFDIKGKMKSGEGEPVPYRNAGEVLREDVVMIGQCSYPALVITVDTYLGEELILKATDYLSPDMLILLKSEVLPISAARMKTSTVVAIE